MADLRPRLSVFVDRLRRAERIEMIAMMTVRVCRISVLGAIVLGLALLWVEAAAASPVSPLSASDYSVHPACGVPAAGHARCLALELVPETAAARARTHPLGMTRSAPIRAGKAAEGADGLRPQDLHSAYALPATASSPQTIAVIDAYNDPEAETDLKVYDEEFGLPACTTANGCFTKLNQEGKASPLPSTEGGWSLEISLDIEVAHATCQNCHILLVEAKTSSYANLEAAEDTAAAAGATEISNSWGGEPPSVDSAAFDHPGVVVTAAAGDDGYLNWDAPNKDERGFADYPASSPHVIAVGGTHLELDSPANTWKSETVWNGDGATGGGCSARFDAQPWQQELPNWSNLGCGSERAVADVAADADPYTGAAVYDTTPYKGEDLRWLPVGGTSLASPLIASVFALAGGADGVEYPAKTLYENQIKRPSSLHDIETGSSGECAKPFNHEGFSGCSATEEAGSCSQHAICLAGPGYNGPTGVGTPDGTSAFEPATAEAPSVATEAVSSLTVSSATLNASVNSNGANVSECEFEYGTSSSYGASVPCSALPGSGTSRVAVSASIAGLAANTEYHYRVSATNSAGTSKGSDEAFKTTAEAPTVTGVSPDAGLESGLTTVTITGTELTGATNVQFGPTSAVFFEVTSPTSITAISPAGTGTVPVTVTTAGGTSTTSPADQFSYVPAGPAPSIKKLSPRRGLAAGGTTVTITGGNFTGVTAVTFGSTDAVSFTVSSATSITAVSPAGTTGRAEVMVRTPNGTSAASTKDDFTFEAPTVTSLSPDTGSATGGTDVTVTGSGFDLGSAATVFRFGNVPGTSVNCTSTSTCTVIAPAAAEDKASTAEVRALVGGKTSKKNPPGDQFTYH